MDADTLRSEKPPRLFKDAESFALRSHQGCNYLQDLIIRKSESQENKQPRSHLWS